MPDSAVLYLVDIYGKKFGMRRRGNGRRQDLPSNPASVAQLNRLLTEIVAGYRVEAIARKCLRKFVMKIAGTQPVQSNTIRRRSESKAGSGTKFASELSTARPPAAAGPTGAAGTIDGILALQEVDEDGRGSRQERERGEDILDRLDEIRHGLLTGRVNPKTLQTLLVQVRQQRQTFTDPRLKEILEEIELRAAVELAKLGQMR